VYGQKNAGCPAPIHFLILVASISLRTFVKKKNLVLIVLSDLTLIAFSYWAFTHRSLSWVLDHIIMEPTVPITVIAILFVVSDWVIRINKRKAQLAI